MKIAAITIIAVSALVLVPAKADYLILSSSFDQKEQDAKLKSFSETLTPFGAVKMYRASNGAVTVAMPCKNTEEAKHLRGLLTGRKLAPEDSYIVTDDKLGSIDAKAAKRLFIQVAARRDRKEALGMARQLSKNGAWNGEVQVWASEPNEKDQRWYRVVIPGESPEKIDALQSYLKTENVIDRKSFVTGSPDLGLQIFSTADKA